MIIIFSNLDDQHATLVRQKLISLYGEHPLILDLSKLAKYMFLRCSYSNLGQQTIEIENQLGTSVDLRSVKSFWWRRPQHIEIDPIIRNPTYQRFAWREWTTAINGAFYSSFNDSLWINKVDKDEIAHHKPYQLSVAKDIGLSIPDTLITNNPSAVVEFSKKHDNLVIYKQFIATKEVWTETRPLTKESLKLINTVRYAPVIFQEYIRNSYDIRVTIVGDEIFSAESKLDNSMYQYDFRMSPRLKWSKHELPESIKEVLLKYMKILGLEYGAIDMKKTSESQYYFLEINPAGEFLFIEYHTNLPIAETMAKHLFQAIRTV